MGCSQLTLIAQEQVPRVVQPLEQMSVCIVIEADLLLSAIETPADLFVAAVVPDFLEALAFLHVGEIFASLVLTEVY